MNWTIRTAAAAALPWATAAVPCDDHVGTCEVEDWRWNAVPGGMLMVDGVATCDEGKITLRLYEGEGGPYLAAETAYIENHIFQTVVIGVERPAAVAIKYSIDPEGQA